MSKTSIDKIKINYCKNRDIISDLDQLMGSRFYQLDMLTDHNQTFQFQVQINSNYPTL